jgi:hypothetical protein
MKLISLAVYLAVALVFGLHAAGWLLLAHLVVAIISSI